MRHPGPEHTPWPAEAADRYRAAGHWRGRSFGAALSALAAEHRDRTAVVGASAAGPARLTYRELDDRAHRVAAGLRDLGVRAGDRVVLQLPNVPEFATTLFGLFRAGAWPVLALPAHREAELRHFAEQTDAVAIVTVDAHEGHDHAATARRVADAVPAVRHLLVLGDPPPGAVDLSSVAAPPRDLPDPDAGGVAFLQLSGGTTGLPKLIPRTHDDYLYSVRESARICLLGPDDAYLAALPVAHNFPLSSPGVLGALHAGACAVLAPDPFPETVFRLVERERVTITGVVPPLAVAYARAAAATARDLSSLRLLQVGGARCSPAQVARVAAALGCAVQQVYGMGEGLVCYTRPDDPPEAVLGTQGTPISPDDELRVVEPGAPAHAEVPPGEVGELLVRGPYTIRGYYRAAEHNATAFTPDGFYRTGDLVRRDAAGRVTVVGRIKDQINRGGEKIAVEEVEGHLLAHPAVLDAAVVGVADDYLGQRSCAYVVLDGDAAEPPTPPQLRRFVRDRGVAPFKVPDRVLVLDRFPVTGVGKTSRRALRAALATLAALTPDGGARVEEDRG
ncbi:(2,3-dihydroxybenzoyl)adenylate synthase [Saccharothrix australiensis]|uniref:2,3-dihydroxybenzoate-AMP ligase n=1 Tax=Saccharothrix australiensis TaxID=2072 RepID=A0A495W476_9PSEU|nr:AMP-binding protein [Saccharothrix australiensis]RKT55463.1 2,3-dihydroxybenzoate-AMP ligase [Saccharothrix australiensis]